MDVEQRIKELNDRVRLVNEWLRSPDLLRQVIFSTVDESLSELRKMASTHPEKVPQAIFDASLACEHKTLKWLLHLAAHDLRSKTD
jgi:hypothetical protein